MAAAGDGATGKDLYEMDIAERVAEATRLKLEGTEAFKAQNWPGAQKAYERGVRFVARLDTDAEREQARAVAMSLHLNLAAVALKLSERQKAIGHASKVLDLDGMNVKALFRRGQAHVQLCNYDDAQKDLRACIAADPGNKDAARALAQCAQAAKAARRKEKGVMAGMFGGLSAAQEEAAAVKVQSEATATAELESARAELRKGNPRVFLDIGIDGHVVGRLTVELFRHAVPKTAENFRALCTGEKGLGKGGKPLHYKGCVFHRIIPGFGCMGGDITSGDGTGGESIYWGGGSFADESFAEKHSKPGMLSMMNEGRNTNRSMFCITTRQSSHMDGRHVVFGEVVDGFDVLGLMESTGTPERPRESPPEADAKAKTLVGIADCGVLSDPQAP